MLKSHNARHHQQQETKLKKPEKAVVKEEKVANVKVKKEVGMGLKCIKCDETFSMRQEHTQ